MDTFFFLLVSGLEGMGWQNSSCENFTESCKFFLGRHKKVLRSGRFVLWRTLLITTVTGGVASCVHWSGPSLRPMRTRSHLTQVTCHVTIMRHNAIIMQYGFFVAISSKAIFVSSMQVYNSRHIRSVNT